MLEYDHVISLGYNCRVAYYMERHGLRGPSLPLDWIKTSVKSVCELFRNDFAGMLDREKLKLRFDTAHHYVSNAKYDCIEFWHEFFRQKTPGNSFLEDYDETRDRFLRRIERFRNIMKSGKKVVFVRKEMWPVATSDDHVTLDDTIKAAWPDLDYRLVVGLNQKAVPENFGRVTFHSIMEVEHNPWVCYLVPWKMLFIDAGLLRKPPVFV